MIKNAVLTMTIAMAGALLGLSGAHAQAGRDACAADVEKFCKDVTPGGGQRYKCLKEHEKDLSEPCRQHIADVKSKVKEMHEACWDDVAKFCDGVKSGHGRILKCLKEHETELSEPCRAALQPPKK